MAYSKKEIKKIKETIIQRISTGKSLKFILDSDKKLPSRPIIYKWLNDQNKEFDKEFLNNYERAISDRADYLVDEIVTIADDQEKDIYINEAGIVCTNHNVISRSTLRVNTRKWIAGKMRPKKYGDRQEINLNTKDVKPIITKRKE